MTWFDPDDVFLDWLVAYARDRVMIELGCGDGKLLERLWARGVKVMGVDDSPRGELSRELQLRTLWQDARTCRPVREHPALVLICRPSHSGWVGDAVRNTHRDSEVLYISKPGNRHIDLPGFSVAKLFAPGCKVEEVWRVLQPYPMADALPDYRRAGLDRTAALAAGATFLAE